MQQELKSESMQFMMKMSKLLTKIVETSIAGCTEFSEHIHKKQQKLLFFFKN